MNILKTNFFVYCILMGEKRISLVRKQRCTMKFNNCQYTHKKRRGLSSVVGILLFVALMVPTFGVLGIVLNSQTDIVSTGREVADTGLKKHQEDLVFNTVLQLPTGFLQVNLTNQGQNAAEMLTIIMTNKSDVGYPTRTFEIPSDTSFLTPRVDKSTNIVSTLNLRLDTPGPGLREDYDFKVISSLGTIKKLSVTCDDTGLCGPVFPPPTGPASLSAQLFLDGPTGINTKTSTVIMFVQNTGGAPLEDVYPVAACNSANFPSISNAPPVIPGRGNFTGCTLTPPPVAAGTCGSPANNNGNGVCLLPGEAVLFKWDGVVEGDIDDVFTFCNQVRGEEYDNTAVGPSPSTPTCDILTVIEPNDCGGCGPGGGDDDPLEERFITRPELFLTIPSPFGEGDRGDDDPKPIIRALWGTNVVNPTLTPMLIHKITITAFPPASNDNFDVIKNGGNTGHLCYPQDISPGDGTVPAVGGGNPAAKRAEEAGFWSCPESNTIMWKNYDNPILLPPQSTFPFLVKLVGDSPVSKTAESVLVDSTVYTTSGSFGKGNYQTTTYDDGMLANIYETTDRLNPLDIDKISTSRTNIPSGSVQKFHIVLAESDVVASTHINATSKVIVNVPRAFTLVDTVMSETTGFVDIPNANATLAEPSVTIHPDKTTQIIATIANDVGDQTSPEAIVLTFEATAPEVTTPKLMVMYTLANGMGTNGNSVGPLSEIILHVIPPP